jgi:hypothetical protein
MLCLLKMGIRKEEKHFDELAFIEKIWKIFHRIAPETTYIIILTGVLIS